MKLLLIFMLLLTGCHEKESEKEMTFYQFIKSFDPEQVATDSIHNPEKINSIEPTTVQYTR